MNKNCKRIVSMLLIVVLLLTTIGANIGAYFTNKDTKIDSYTIGEIDIEVTGDDNLYSADLLTPNYEYEFKRAVHNTGINDAFVFMAVTLPIDEIYIHDLDGVHTGEVASLTQLFTYGNNGALGISDEWRLVNAGKFGDYDLEEIGDKINNKSDNVAAIRINNTITYVYAYVGNGDTLAKLAPDATTSNLFETMKFVNASDTVAEYNVEETVGQIKVQAYAIQAQNILEETYMQGNNSDGSEAINSVWEVVNNALVRTNDQPMEEELSYIVYVAGSEIVQPSLKKAENTYGETLTKVNAISDTELYNYLIETGNYDDVSRDQNMDVIGGVIYEEPASTMSIRSSVVSQTATYVLVAKDNTIIMAPPDVTDMFANLFYIKQIIFENLYFNNTTNMNGMFQGSTNLEQVVFPTEEKVINVTPNSGGLDNTTTETVVVKPTYSNVSDVTSIFSGCANLTDVNVNVFTEIKEASNMFDGCENITEVDLSTWEYIDITWLWWLYNSGASSIEKIEISKNAEEQLRETLTEEELDKIMSFIDALAPSGMLIAGPAFNGLVGNTMTTVTFTNTAIPSDVETIDVSARQDGSVVAWYEGTKLYIARPDGGTICANMNSSKMFYGCEKLKTVNFNGPDVFNTSKATDMSWMFYYCRAITSIDVSCLDTSKVTTMDWMFGWCTSATNINVYGIDVSNVTTMMDMFSHCSSLRVLDLSSFETSKLTNTRGMFYNSSSLETIYVSELWDMSGVTNSIYMFGNLDKSVAHYGNGGKLTYKAYSSGMEEDDKEENVQLVNIVPTLTANNSNIYYHSAGSYHSSQGINYQYLVFDGNIVNSWDSGVSALLTKGHSTENYIGYVFENDEYVHSVDLYVISTGKWAVSGITSAIVQITNDGTVWEDLSVHSNLSDRTDLHSFTIDKTIKGVRIKYSYSDEWCGISEMVINGYR